MSILNQVQRGANHRRPLRVLFHGPPKAGKTHLAAGAPDALHLDCEGGAEGFDHARLPITSWHEFRAAINDLSSKEHPFRTVIIDTLDALERYCGVYICQSAKGSFDSPSEMPYGQGWAAVEGAFHEVTEQIAWIQKRRGMNVIIIAHSSPTTHNEPDGTSWKQYRMRVNKRTHELIAGWVEDIGFVHTDVRTLKGVGKSSQRVIEFRDAPAWEAGSRRVKQPRLVIPDDDPAACWAIISKAYREGIPAQEKRREAQAKDAPAPSANEPAQSERTSREPTEEDVAGKDDGGTFVRRREHRREWFEAYLAAEAKEADHELTVEDKRVQLLGLLIEQRQAELGDFPYEQLWKGDPPTEALDHKDLTRLKEWLAEHAADFEPEWSAGGAR